RVHAVAAAETPAPVVRLDQTLGRLRERALERDPVEVHDDEASARTEQTGDLAHRNGPVEPVPALRGGRDVGRRVREPGRLRGRAPGGPPLSPPCPPPPRPTRRPSAPGPGARAPPPPRPPRGASPRAGPPVPVPRSITHWPGRPMPPAARRSKSESGKPVRCRA